MVAANIVILANNFINSHPLTTAVMFEKVANQLSDDKNLNQLNISLSYAMDWDRDLYRYGVFNSSDKFYKLVRQMSDIPKILDYRIRELGESKSKLMKAVVVMRLIEGIDIDGSPVNNKDRTITLGGK